MKYLFPDGQIVSTDDELEFVIEVKMEKPDYNAPVTEIKKLG